MSLKDEFKIPESTWRAMIKRGVISCAVNSAEEILERVNSKKRNGITHSEAIKITSIELNVSERWVYKTIEKYS